MDDLNGLLWRVLRAGKDAANFEPRAFRRRLDHQSVEDEIVIVVDEEFMTDKTSSYCRREAVLIGFAKP